MVLRRRELLSLALSTLAVGCLPKGGGLVKAPAPMDAAVAGVLRMLDSGQVTALPEVVFERVGEALGARDLTPQPLDVPATLVAFGERRVTPQRLSWMAGQGQHPLLLLLETEVEFYSQLSGRFRWTVRVQASVAPREDLGQAVSSSFEVPVFLQFHHEREQAAIEQAAPVIERQVGHLLDEVLGGL